MIQESQGFITSINISQKKGIAKGPVEEVLVTSLGLIKDAHAGHGHRQVSLLASEKIEAYNKSQNQMIQSGEFGENITTKGLDFSQAAPFDLIKTEEVELEITQIGKKCHNHGNAIYQTTGDCIMPHLGVFTRVLTPGKIKINDHIIFKKIPFKIKIITMSDRANSGEYQDQSGPIIYEIINPFLKEQNWLPDIEKRIMSDSKKELKAFLTESIQQGSRLIIITGGTGLGPRDITPEVLKNFCDKEIPGVMEMIRWKFGKDNPNALLSRSFAGTKNQCLLFALPGSPKAVKEYIEEILPVLSHGFKMVAGIGH